MNDRRVCLPVYCVRFEMVLFISFNFDRMEVYETSVDTCGPNAKVKIGKRDHEYDQGL